MVIIAIGIKTNKFKHCATFCGVFIKSVNNGIKKVPPPIPIPAKIPDNTEIKRYHRKFTTSPPLKSSLHLQQS